MPSHFLDRKSRIARTRATLEHALAIQATPTTEERIGDIVIRDDAVAGQVEIKFPSDLPQSLAPRRKK